MKYLSFLYKFNILFIYNDGIFITTTGINGVSYKNYFGNIWFIILINIYDKISCHLYGDYYRLIRHITNYIHEYIKISEYNILDETITNSVKLIDKLEIWSNDFIISKIFCMF